MIKDTQLTEEQLNAFRRLESTLGSQGTLLMPNIYPPELKYCGINERGAPRNQLLGCVLTQPSGSQLALQTAFYDTKDNQDDGDLHIVNFSSKILTSHYQGWGTWSQLYGNNHHECKDYLRAGTTAGSIL